MKVIYLMILIVIGLNNNVHSQQLTFSNLTQILDFKNEFDLNEYLDTKKFIFFEERRSDTTTKIKIYGYESVSKNESEEAIILYYDLSDKLAKVDYIFGGLAKNNKFKSSYTPNNLVRRQAWNSNNVNNAIFCNSKYTMYYKSFKNDLHLNANTYIYELVKRYGTFDRRDGYVEYYRQSTTDYYSNADSAYYDGIYFLDFKYIGESREWFTDDNKHYIQESTLNKFGKYNKTYSLSINGDKPLIYKSSIAEENKLILNYLLIEKFQDGDLKGIERGRGYFNDKHGEFTYSYKFNVDKGVYSKVYERVMLSNYNDSPYDEYYRDFAVQRDDISYDILRFDVNAVPNGKYYYKDDEITIEGEYDYGLKDGLWIYKKNDKIIKSMIYKNGDLVEE